MPTPTPTAVATSTATPTATTGTPPSGTATSPPETATPTPAGSVTPTPAPDPKAGAAVPTDGVIRGSGTVSLRRNRTSLGAPALNVRGATVTVDGSDRRITGPWTSMGAGVNATNESVDALVVRDLALTRWGTGVAVADADAARVEDSEIGVIHRGVVARNVSAVTVADTRLVAATAGAFHGVGTVSLRNVTAGSHGTFVFDGGTRAEASNVSLHGRTRVGFTARNVAVTEADGVPRLPTERTRAGPVLEVHATGEEPRLRVSLPARAPPGTPASTVAVWRYDGNWTALPTTRTADGRVRATLTPDAEPSTVAVLGAAEPHLVSPRLEQTMETTVGNATTDQVSVRNAGTAPLAATNVTVEGANASAFAVTDDGSTTKTNRTAAKTEALVLPPGSSHTVEVRFAPASTGAKHARLTFARVDGGTASVPVGGDATRAAEATAPTNDTAPGGEVGASDDDEDRDGDEADEADEDGRVVREENGRRLLRVSENLWLVLNPQQPDSPVVTPKKGTDTTDVPEVGTPTVTTTPANETEMPTPEPRTETPVTATRETGTEPATPATPGGGPGDGAAGSVPTPGVTPTGSPPKATPTETHTRTGTTPATTPGFGVLPVLVAVGGSCLVVRRRR
ncbi:hypothetical protein [Salinigranum marinum]|uniref:hypothetical protein n=1 Tax=Salinigranum marinum TaxID=1515595 RepID=UPI002989E6F9|nr:hypothetical protein [Salinigranum marinum]